MKPLGEEVFNPLDKTNLAESVRDHLLKRPVVQLPPERFVGAGIYAIYYTGGFPAYQRIARTAPSDEKAIPIYVGKAVPSGSRKGGYGLGADPEDVLHKRLSEHASSIESARNLKLTDFRCRYLLGECRIPELERNRPVEDLVVRFYYGGRSADAKETGR